MKSNLFLLVSTILLLIALILYEPKEIEIETDIPEQDLITSEESVERNEILLLYTHDFICYTIHRCENYSLIEVKTYNYSNLQQRLEDVHKVLSSWDKYSGELDIWIVKSTNTEIVEFTYEDGKLTKYGY